MPRALEILRIWLECNHAPRVSHEPGRESRVEAEVGSDVPDNHSTADQARHRTNLRDIVAARDVRRLDPAGEIEGKSKSAAGAGDNREGYPSFRVADSACERVQY